MPTFSTLMQMPLTLGLTCAAVWIGLSESASSALDIHLKSQFGTIQLLTCHLTHWSTNHLFWDVSMFAVLGALCERSASRAFYAVVFGGALLIPLCVMLNCPEIDTYRGLSGIDTAVFALLVSLSLLKNRAAHETSGTIVFGSLLGLLWCKIGFEFWSGGLMFVQSMNFQPLPIAHAVGAILGSTVAAAYLGGLMLQCESRHLQTVTAATKIENRSL